MKDNEKWKQYRLAGVILLIGCVLSAAILILPQVIVPESNPSPDAKTAIDYNEEQLRENIPQCTVSFCDETGRELITKQAVQGDPVVPPMVEKTGYVLRGWSVDVFHTSGDTKAFPEYEAVGDKKNAIYGGCIYSEIPGGFSVPVYIGGEVDCCDFQIEIAYDHGLLVFDGSETLLEGLSAEDDTENGLITLKWSSEKSIMQPQKIAELKFTVEQTGLFRTNLAVLTKEIHALDSGKRFYTDSTAYDFDIYLITFNKGE